MNFNQSSLETLEVADQTARHHSIRNSHSALSKCVSLHAKEYTYTLCERHYATVCGHRNVLYSINTLNVVGYERASTLLSVYRVYSVRADNVLR
jgi:hypothetical protein